MDAGHQIYLAPFQGITTYTYREVYTKYFSGVNKLFTPFFTGIQKISSLNKKAIELNFNHQNGIEVVPQILSKDAEEIIKFAIFCSQKGFKEINWNLGCPYPRVANKKRGSGMLPYPEMVDDILDKIFPEIDIRFSIKCRLGYYSADEILKLMEVYNNHPIHELTIHARIGKQLYTGGVDIQSLQKSLINNSIPVVYNGDIFSKTDYSKMNSNLPDITRWMIGRGLLVDPFLPVKISRDELPELALQKEIVYKFITDLYLAYRKKTNNRLQSISVMKELWGNMSYAFNKPQKVFNRIKKTNSFDDYEQAVADVFAKYDWIGSEAELFKQSL